MQGLALTRRHFVRGSTALGLVAAARPKLAWPAGESVLRVRSYMDLQILDPAFEVSTPDGDISRCILNKLIDYKPGDIWEWELDAARSIEQIDDTHVAFTLRPGIMWSDGFGEMTAEDVKFSFERIADPTMESPYAEDWATLDRVDVTDTYSGVIVLKEPFAPLWATTLPWTSGTIVCKKAVESMGGKYETEPPAVSGPYTIKEWMSKHKTVLSRNPHWNGPKPGFDEIHIFPIQDEKTAELAFEAGDLDFTRLSLSSLPKYREKLPPGAKLLEKPSLMYVWLGINVDHPQFQDIRVRKAIQRAIDVDAIMEAYYFGAAKPSTGIIAPGLIGHREGNLTAARPDFEGARKLVAEAGYAGGFKTTLDVLNKQTYLSAGQIIQANLAEIGVEVQINVLDSGTFWSRASWKYIQLQYVRFSMGPDPGWGTMWFTCDQVGIGNWERWCNEEFTQLHRQALVELDPYKRHGMYVRMQDLMEESGAFKFITHEATPAIYRDTIIPATLPDGRMLLPKFKPA